MANDQVQCPNCNSTGTRPSYGTGNKDGWHYLVGKLTFRRFTFNNPEYLKSFKAGKLKAVCMNCHSTFSVEDVHQTSLDKVKHIGVAIPQLTLAERLEELDDAYAKRLLSDQEYAQKRQKLIDDL